MRTQDSSPATKATPAVKLFERPRLRSGKSITTPAAEPLPPNRYRVGSIAKTGRVLWAYNELLTLDEAEEIASSSRLTILAPGCTVPKTLPLSPRAVQRLEKFRNEARGSGGLDRI